MAICSKRPIEDARTSRASHRTQTCVPDTRAARVIRLGHLDVPVPIHLPLGFVKVGEPFPRQRQQRRAAPLLKELLHLPLGGAMNPRVGDRPFPVRQALVLVFQAGELVRALSALFLHILHSRLHLPLCRGM